MQAIDTQKISLGPRRPDNGLNASSSDERWEYMRTVIRAFGFICVVAGGLSFITGTITFRWAAIAVGGGSLVFLATYMNYNSCSPSENKKPGIKKSYTIDLWKPITSVTLKIPHAKLYIEETTGPQNFIVTTEEKILKDALKIRLDKKHLILDLKSNAIMKEDNVVKCVLRIQHIQTLTVSEEADVTIHNLESKHLICNVANKSCVTVMGQTKKQDVTVKDSAYIAPELSCQETNVALIGMSEASVQAHNTLDVRIQGDGICTYSGDPELISHTIGKDKSLIKSKLSSGAFTECESKNPTGI